MPIQDPYRQDARSATDDDLNALVEFGPVSRGLGLGLTFEDSQITDRLLGFIGSDDERRFDAHRGRMFGEAYRNEMSPQEANAIYGVEGYLNFDGPVNVHRAQEMNRQALTRRYRQETAARADLSTLDTLGASLAGSALDPVLLPTWFIGGGSAALRAFRLAPAAGRGVAAARGAAVGMIDGLAGGMAAEGLNATARTGAGEDYDWGDALKNILFGTALGAGIGGATGGLFGAPGTTPGAGARRETPNGRSDPAPPSRPAGDIPDLIARIADQAGENASTAIRIAQLESTLNPAAKNPRSSAAGLFQFIDSTWARFGGGDRLDPELSSRNGVRLMAENRAALRRGLGRDPAEWELYLAHQQGAGGAVAMLKNPDANAVEVLRGIGSRNPLAAVRLNGGDAATTAGEFAAHWRRKFGAGADVPEFEAPSVPPVIRGLTDNERVGGFAEALEAMAEDAPLDLGPSLARRGIETLDETSAVPSIRGRWLEPDLAVTRGGTELPVRFAVVEMADLKTSHGDDLTPDGAYPQALQPRDRTRAGSQAENYALERDLNPALLMRDKAAAGGAPIISPDGVVESGNGRTIALRRSARTGTEAWGRYRAELEKQGFDTTGFNEPVLVRMRTEPMTGAARARLTGDLNVSPTEAYSPVEQARADARRLDRETLGLLDGDDAFAAANRPFLRGFVQRVAPGDANALTDARGAISLSGKARVQAALVQAAYGDDALTAALFEATDANVRAIGQALADAAPAWARMRAEAPGAMDITANLTGAVALVREARASRQGVGDLLALRLGQTELFGGEAISPETEALIRLMFRDEGLTKPRGNERIAEALKDYARAAGETPDGPDLFGETPDGRRTLDALLARYAGAEGEGRTGLSYAGGSEPAWTTRELSGREAESPVLDLRPAEPVGEGPGGSGQRPQDGGRPARPGGPDAETRVAELIAADPELKALVDDTEALARAAGIDPPAFDPSTEPSTLAEAIRAAAFCLTTNIDASL